MLEFPRWRFALEPLPCATSPLSESTLRIDGATLTLAGRNLSALRSGPGHLADAVTLRRALGRLSGPRSPKLQGCPGIGVALRSRIAAMLPLHLDRLVVVLRRWRWRSRRCPGSPTALPEPTLRIDGATLTLAGATWVLFAAAPATWPMPLPCAGLCDAAGPGFP